MDELLNFCVWVKLWGDNWSKNKQATSFLKDTQHWPGEKRITYSIVKNLCQDLKKKKKNFQALSFFFCQKKKKEKVSFPFTRCYLFSKPTEAWDFY